MHAPFVAAARISNWENAEAASYMASHSKLSLSGAKNTNAPQSPELRRGTFTTEERLRRAVRQSPHGTHDTLFAQIVLQRRPPMQHSPFLPAELDADLRRRYGHPLRVRTHGPMKVICGLIGTMLLLIGAPYAFLLVGSVLR